MRYTLRLALTALAAVRCTGDTPAPGFVGASAPSYHARDLGGDSATLDQFRGDVLLLNVWATWCEPCRDEMPALQAAHRDYAVHGLRVVGVSIDQRAGDVDVRRFVEQHGITFPILRDPDDRVSRVFHLIGVPSSVLIDRDGVIVHRWIGPFDPGSAENRAVLMQALSGPA